MMSIGGSDEFKAGEWPVDQRIMASSTGRGDLAEEADEQFHIRPFVEWGNATHATSFHREIEHCPLAAALIAQRNTVARRQSVEASVGS